MKPAEALAWIMFRDEGFTAKAADETLLGLAVRISGRIVLDGIKPARSRDAALAALLSRCAGARVNATGIPCREEWRGSLQFIATGRRMPIPAHSWPDLHLFELHGKMAIEPKPGSSSAERYIEPLFRRIDVLRVFSQVPKGGKLAAKAAPSGVTTVPEMQPTAARAKGIANVIDAMAALWPPRGLPPSTLGSDRRDDAVKGWLARERHATASRSTIERAIRAVRQVDAN